MRIYDRLRIEATVLRYDYWLEMRGVRGRDRRDLRGELRANLHEASADVGTTRALFGIGSPKQLAHAAPDVHPSRPRGASGLPQSSGSWSSGACSQPSPSRQASRRAE